MGTPGAAAIGTSRRLSRRARETFSPRPRLSELRDPRRDCKTRGAARGERPLVARSRRRAALSRHCKIAFVRGACAIARIGRALCAATRHGGSLRARRRPVLDRAWRRSRWRSRRGGRPAGSVGRRHSRAQGNANQLSPLGGGRRCLARGDRGGAGSGPVLVDQRPPAIAAAAWPAAADLPPPPPHPRCCGTETLEVDRGHRLARTPRRRCDAGRHSPPGRPALIATGLPWARRKPKRLRRDSASPAMAWWGRPGSGESWRQNRAHGAPSGRRKGGRRKNALPALPRPRRASALPCLPRPVLSRQRSRRSRMRSARRLPVFWPSAVSWRHPTSASGSGAGRSEEHTSELQSRRDLVCRLLLEKKKKLRVAVLFVKKQNEKSRRQK